MTRAESSRDCSHFRREIGKHIPGHGPRYILSTTRFALLWLSGRAETCRFIGKQPRDAVLQVGTDPGRARQVPGWRRPVLARAKNAWLLDAPTAAQARSGT